MARYFTALIIFVGFLAIIAAGIDFVVDDHPVCFQHEIERDRERPVVWFKYDMPNIAGDPVGLVLTMECPDGTQFRDVDIDRSKAYTFAVHPCKDASERDWYGPYTVCIGPAKARGFASIFANSLPVTRKVSNFVFAAPKKSSDLPPADDGSGLSKSDDQKENVVFGPNKYELMRTIERLKEVEKLSQDALYDQKALVMGQIEGQSTTNSTFSRVWISALATMIALAISGWITYWAVTHTLRMKKLV